MDNVDVIFLAGQHPRPGGPCKVEVPVGISAPMNVKVEGEIDEEEEVEMIGYLEPLDDSNSTLYVILPDLKARSEFETSFTPEPVETDEKVVLEKVSDQKINVKIGDKLFTSFQYNEGKEANRPYLYPLMAPSGVGVTRSLPKNKKEGDTKDHPHHKSCWTAWGDVNGKDNWAYGRTKARQEVNDVKIEENPVFGKLTLDITWKKPLGGKQLSETRQIWFYNCKGDKIVDFDIALTAIKKDVKFGDTKEGGFLSVRVATPMDVPRGGRIENAFGAVSEEECWGKRAPWCDYSGEVEGKKVGVVIFDHVENVNYPTYWHVRDYGLMGANPFGISYFKGKQHDGSHVLEEGKTLRFRYRLIVHDGDATDADLAQQYLNWYLPWKTPVFKL